MGEMNEQVHRLLLEQRKTLSLGGVQDVKSFDENEVLLVYHEKRHRYGDLYSLYRREND